MRRVPAFGLGLLMLAACQATLERRVLQGDSHLARAMNDASVAVDVPAELLGALAWVETALRPGPGTRELRGEIPRAIGVMALPEEGPVRSIARAAEILGVDRARLEEDVANVQAAAALLRVIADELYGPGELRAEGSRERWLRVVGRYFDAGAAGAALALEVRRTVAQGLRTVDARGASFVIPSFAELYPRRDGVAEGAAALSAEYPRATWVAASSSNYATGARGPSDIDVVVLHTIQGSYAGAISWFRNPSARVSAHYVVRRSDGAITQMVQHKDVAWHAGNSTYNHRSIGIEHEGYVSDPANYTPAMLQASAELTRWLADNLGIPLDRSHIIGHIEVPGATHTDPGVYFPWDDYMSRVRNAGPVPIDVGLLQGVVFVAGDSARRLPGATVRVSPGGHVATARAEDAYWSFTLPPGAYTIEAEASGYQTSTVSRSVTSGGEVWGSVGLVPSANTGTLRGHVYDARVVDQSVRIEGATVELSGGLWATTSVDGLFELAVSPGIYTLTVRKTGWVTATNQASVTGGAITTASTGLLPEGEPVTNHAPDVPAPVAPTQGVSTRTARPVFTAGGIRDPDGDPVTLEIEVHLGQVLVSTGQVRVQSQDRLVSWQHPLDDLPRGKQLVWRVRASDGTLASGWSAPATFETPLEAALQEATTPWTADPLPGVGSDSPPPAPVFVEPVDEAVVDVVRPRLLVRVLPDLEGDVLDLQLQVASDDVFTRLEGDSGVLPSPAEPTWTVTRDLAPAGRYYARARVADRRSFSPWSSQISFTISADATSGNEEVPNLQPDWGEPPRIQARLIPDEAGCSSTGRASGGPWLLLLLLGLGWRRARRPSR